MFRNWRGFIYLLACRNLLWDILRLPSSRRAAMGLYVILTLWRGRGANQPPYTLLHRSLPRYALRHGRRVSFKSIIQDIIFHSIPRTTQNGGRFYVWLKTEELHAGNLTSTLPTSVWTHDHWIENRTFHISETFFILSFLVIEPSEKYNKIHMQTPDEH